MNQLPGRGPPGVGERDAHPRAGAQRPHPSGARGAQADGRAAGMGPPFGSERGLPQESPWGRACPRRPDGRGSHPEPRTGNGDRPPASSGFDKLNLRALEKLQEEESEECAEWLEGALSPRELRPPRASPRPPGPAPPERAPGRRGRDRGPGHPLSSLLPGATASHLPDAAPPPSPAIPSQLARTCPRRPPGQGGVPAPNSDDDIRPRGPARARPGRGRVRRGRGRQAGAGSGSWDTPRGARGARPTAGPRVVGEGARPRPTVPGPCAPCAPAGGHGGVARRLARAPVRARCGRPGRPTDLCESSGAP